MKANIVRGAQGCTVCLDDVDAKNRLDAFYGDPEADTDVLVLAHSPDNTPINTLYDWWRKLRPGDEISVDYTFRRRCPMHAISLADEEATDACDLYTNLLLEHYKLVIELDEDQSGFTDPQLTTFGCYSISAGVVLLPGHTKALRETVKAVMEKDP